MRHLVELVEQKFPESGFGRWLRLREFPAPCNMLVARKDLFFDWCEFLFPLVFELRGKLRLSKNSY